MPRSHRITSVLPSPVMYPAAASHSSYVADMPRFSRTGMPLRPAARSSGVFCIERAPIIITSAWPRSISMSATPSGSATIGRPVRSRASSSRRNPRAPKPWKECACVRGLSTQPRRADAPARAAASACATYSASTAQGPAMTGTASPPMTTPPISTRRVVRFRDALERSGSMTTDVSSVIGDGSPTEGHRADPSSDEASPGETAR